MKNNEDVPKKRSFFVRSIRLLFLVDLFILLGRAVNAPFCVAKQSTQVVGKNLKDCKNNKEKAKKMTFDQFLEHHGLEWELIGRKKNMLLVEIFFVLVVAMWELAILLHSNSTVVTVQASLTLFVFGCLVYLRAWFFYVLTKSEYIPLNRWLLSVVVSTEVSLATGNGVDVENNSEN